MRVAILLFILISISACQTLKLVGVGSNDSDIRNVLLALENKEFQRAINIVDSKCNFKNLNGIDSCQFSTSKQNILGQYREKTDVQQDIKNYENYLLGLNYCLKLDANSNLEKKLKKDCLYDLSAKGWLIDVENRRRYDFRSLVKARGLSDQEDLIINLKGLNGLMEVALVDKSKFYKINLIENSLSLLEKDIKDTERRNELGKIKVDYKRRRSMKRSPASHN